MASMRVVANVNGQKFRVPCNKDDQIMLPQNPTKAAAPLPDKDVGNRHQETAPSPASPSMRGSNDNSMRNPTNPLDPRSEPLDSWARRDAMRVTSVDGHADGVTHINFQGDTLITAQAGEIDSLGYGTWNLRMSLLCLYLLPPPRTSISLEIFDCRRVLHGHTSNLRCAEMQRGILTSGGEATGRIWNFETGKPTGTFDGHDHYISAMSLDDELRLVTASWDRTLKVWHVKEGGTGADCSATLRGHSSSVLSLQRNGDRAVSGSLSGELLVWNLLTGQNTFKTAPSEGHAIAGSRLVFASLLAILFVLVSVAFNTISDRLDQIVDLNAGKKVQTLIGHDDVITCIITSLPWIITGSRDSTVKVWSSRSWTCVRTISAPGVRCLGLSHRLLAVGMDTGELQVWQHE
ncbi:hypothetical protein GUITHDRAFT_118325 [Guillardia theta CCMP2712]|uniref:Uncharacterized protein n=1 Tax=Guillardia theta (strain CCMP2712) TaxID=905079 RepID=L1IHU2_GUITC|nr:hypothetical protein GUITHDRAFT_118325 [Guillardia theta CCMP2712]EKX35514.1 hypothetical protein GUITHDRAFT_118325 [Guillardia theta CCMP2712]|eukprot:XP_005822494.1 hypothetical protein GUITHDRAFT_118325 [Guillardia theta CCMP2712]